MLKEENIKDEDFYKIFSHLYTQLVVENKAPWLKEGVPERGVAYNPKSGVVFRGVNSLILEFKAAQAGFKDSRWLSQKQIDDLGLKPRYGEFPTPIAYINKYAAPVNVNPVTGEKFSVTDPKKRYYLVYNIEQLRSYDLKHDRDFIISKKVTTDKIKKAIENSGTNDFRVIKSKLVKNVVQAVPDRMQILAAGLAQYRLSQELRVPYKSTIPKEDLESYKHIKIKESDLLRTVYHVETYKDRLVSKDEALEHENTRTVTKVNKKEQEQEQERD
jgi:hypothetical protein